MKVFHDCSFIVNELLEVFFSKTSQRKPQWKNAPDDHDAESIEQSQAAAEEVFINSAGISHQRAYIHLEHDEYSSKVDWVQR